MNTRLPALPPDWVVRCMSKLWLLLLLLRLLRLLRLLLLLLLLLLPRPLPGASPPCSPSCQGAGSTQHSEGPCQPAPGAPVT
jgi:hypothetical protein